MLVLDAELSSSTVLSVGAASRSVWVVLCRWRRRGCWTLAFAFWVPSSTKGGSWNCLLAYCGTCFVAGWSAGWLAGWLAAMLAALCCWPRFASS